MEIRHCLADAVRRRLVSDVPVGAFLSGGIDSSTVVALMARASSAPIQTFSIGFERQDFDERPFARLVAKRFGTDHHEFLVDADAATILPKLAWHYGEPFADPSAIPTYLVSQLARGHVGVVLNGDGGDEAFLGYDSYGHYWRHRWIEGIPIGLRRAVSRRAERVDFWKESSRLRRGLAWRVADFDERGSRRHARFMAYFGDGDKAAAYGPALRPFLPSSSLDRWERWFAQASDMLSGAAWCDIHTYLPDGLLVKVDVASMAHGLEARSPFLDRAVMALAATIPAEQKFVGGVQKGLLRRAVADLLPVDIVNRPKRGFGVPIQQWLAGDLHAFARDVLLSAEARQRGLFESRAIERMLDEHRQGRRLHHTRLWAALCLELWSRMWIDAPVVPKHP
jgi:asparagine synthase (glutamine-hydrolysing)